MRNKRSARLTAGVIACVVPALAVAFVLASARTMAAPLPSAPTPDARAVPANTSPSVCFYRDRAPVCVTRSLPASAASADDQARALLAALIAGPSASESAAGLRSALPRGAQLAGALTSGDEITVKLILPESFLYGSFNALVSDEIVGQIVKTLYALPSLRKFHVLALDPRDAAQDAAQGAGGVFKPISYFLFEPPATHKEDLAGAPTGRVQPASTRTGQPGALAGKAVYLSAGHGWYWNEGYDRWDTQRYASGGYDTIEDMNNAEVVNQYLVPYLRNAGADVWPVREEDMHTQEIIVTHNQPAYSDVGDWFDSASTGYQGQPYRYAVVNSTATATATWTLTFTTAGRYAVYAWYALSDNRAPDAQYLVAHAGGVTEARVNQRAHGLAWRYLGTFFFMANVPGRVMLTNQSAVSGTVVVADAIRAGGGVGDQHGDGPPASPGPSGKPRWEEAARYWAKYQGAPSSVYAPCDPDEGDDCDDVTARPRYAEWERSSSEDAVFVSWHTNASNIGARGTESYIYDGAWGGTFTPGSDRLQHWIHTALVSDIRAGWESDWTDRGKKQANFGEVRALETMPGTLIEIAFHDQVDDANALKDARFAQLAARAVYKGIVRFFAEQDGSTLQVVPEPPRNLIVRNSGPGQVAIAWRPSPTDTNGLLGDAARGYRVYTSQDGLGWDNGTPVTGTSLVLNGLTPNQLVFIRVTATNLGGESFPAPVAAARVAGAGATPVLVVYGYERIDRYLDVERCDTPTSGNCPNVRIWPEQMNNASYLVQHAQAITLPLDSAMRGAIDDGDLTLAGYAIVDWIAGQEQTPASIPNGTNEVALTSAERAALAVYLNSGKALLMSGAEVAFDLNQLGQQSFLNNTLRAQFAGDDANTFTVTPSAGGIFSGLALFSFDDGSHGAYRVGYPDVLTPANGSVAALGYSGGTGGTAAIQYANGCQRLVYLGFPFEAIYPASTRQAVMSRVLGFLSVCLNLPEAAILSPAANGFYNARPPIHGSATGLTPADHVDVALVDAANSRFWNGTGWVAAQTWLSATGKTAWAYTPSVTLADGPFAVWARAWTASGLSSAHTARVTFTMDTIAPTTPVIITPTGGITLPASSVTLVFTPAHDANGVAGYTVQLNGELFTTTATSYVPRGLRMGPNTWSVRAFDMAGNASGWATAAFSATPYLAFLPLVLRDYAPLPPVEECQELIANGGFETRDVWASLSSLKPVYVSTPTHTGLASLQIGLTTTPPVMGPSYSSIQQAVTIPLTATQTLLTFWRYPVSSDVVGDRQYVYVGPDQSHLSQVWQTRSNEQAWVSTTISLSTYSGPLVVLFGVYNDGSGGVTAMYLDDVSVQACRQ